ncbi:hypothetical protein ACRJ4W_34715 [Streptomyces sp. GLT-R25]
MRNQCTRSECRQGVGFGCLRRFGEFGGIEERTHGLLAVGRGGEPEHPLQIAGVGEQNGEPAADRGVGGDLMWWHGAGRGGTRADQAEFGERVGV